VSDWDRERSEYEMDASLCSLPDSEDPRNLNPAEKPDEGNEYICLTCKRTSSNRKKLCYPAFN
jgi:hypothetical protein